MSTTTKMQFEAMEKALPYAAELMECKSLKDFKKDVRGNKNMTNGEMMQALMPIFLKEKQEAVFGLLGAVSGKTAQEIAEQEWSETKELMGNPIIADLYDFFTFSVRMARNA